MEVQKEKRIRALSTKTELDMHLTQEISEYHMKLNEKMDHAKN
jgi:hypothetical protein